MGLLYVRIESGFTDFNLKRYFVVNAVCVFTESFYGRNINFCYKNKTIHLDLIDDIKNKYR